MHTKSNNVEIVMGSETDEIIKDLFESFLQKHQEGLEESMRGSEFAYDSVDALYYNLNNISLNSDGSYIDSPKSLKNEKSTINPKNNDDKCFQYVLTVALNYEKIKKDLQRISKIKHFIDQYNWKDTEFPSHSKDWKKFELNNKSVRDAYESKHNLTPENQVIILMITDGEKRHYPAVKSLSALFMGITSKHEEDFYCLNCFQSYTTENKLKKHKKVCENHDYCYVDIPEKDNKILKYNQGEKSIKVPFIIYADLESLLEKMNTCHNNPEKLSTTKINKHTPSGCSLFTHCSFDTRKNKLYNYRGKNCMRNFCLDLSEHVTKIINYEKKEMIPLTKEEKRLHRIQRRYYICKKKFSTNDNNKKYHKVSDHCHYTGK